MRLFALLLACSTSIPVSGAAISEGQNRTPQVIPNVAEITRLIASDVLADQAWGAWFAAQARAEPLIPALQSLARRHPSSSTWPAPAVTGAALDALVQIGARLPAGWSRDFLNRWPVESLILMSRASDDAGGVLVEITRTQTGYPWLAAANLALPRRTPGLAASLLSNVDINATVFVTTNKDARYETGGSMGGGVADGGIGRLPGFPPVTYYAMTTAGTSGAIIVAAGPIPIYAERRVSAPGETALTSSQFEEVPTTRHRLQYAAALLDMQSMQLPVQSLEARTVVWTNQAVLDAAVAAFKADILERFAGLVRRLVSGGLMTKEEAAALPAPKVTVEIRDARGTNDGGLKPADYSTCFSVGSSAAIRSDLRNRRSLALISRPEREPERLLPCPFVDAASRLENATTASRETRMSYPAARAFSRHASTRASLATAAETASVSSRAN